MSFSSLLEHTQAVGGFADLVEVCKPRLNNDHMRQNCVLRTRTPSEYSDFPFSPVTGDFTGLHRFSNAVESALGPTLACSLRTLGLIKCQGPVYVQVSPIILAWVFSYKTKYSYLLLILRLRDMGNVRSMTAEKLSQKEVKCQEILSALSMWIITDVLGGGGVHLFKFSFSNQYTSGSSFFFFPAPLPHSAPAVPKFSWSHSYTPKHHPCSLPYGFQCPCISFSHFESDQKGRLSFIGLLPALSDFLHVRIKSFCGSRKRC